MIRQERAQEKDIHVSLRTVERTVAPLRRELAAEARATVRFETPPGEQLQIDFGERRVEIAGVATKAFFLSRCWAIRADTSNLSMTWSMHRPRRAGLSSFPRQFPSE